MASYEQPPERYPLSAFGVLFTTNPHPVVQISGQYGALDKVDTNIKNGGTATVDTGVYTASTGTNSAGYGAIESERHVVYHAGQGGEGLFTAAFTTGVANSMQFGGMFSTSDALGFGYVNDAYGCIYLKGGVAELQTLQVTGAASGSENATITVDGNAYTVPLTSGTVQHNAYEIAVSLSSQDTEGNYTSNDDTVTYISKTNGSLGSFAFSSSTATASWTQVAEGADPTVNFTARENWNVDTCPWLDPTKSSPYKVDFQYLGSGGFAWYVEKPNTRRLVLVHIQANSNATIVPTLRNPSFKLGWFAKNSGNTSNLTVRGISAMGAVQGAYRLTELPRGFQSTVNTDTTEVGVIHIRCRTHFSDIENMAEVFVRAISIGTDSSKGAIFTVYVNATPASDLDFSYVDESNSIVETATGGGALSNGRTLASFTVGATSGDVISGEDLKQWIHPGEVLSISAKVLSGAASDCSASMTWQEDL